MGGQTSSSSSGNPFIPMTQTVQELEKIKFSYDLRKNPDDYNRYVSERVDRIANETLEKKRASFQKAHTDMGRYFDMDHNANFYRVRNNDVLRLQAQMVDRSRAAFRGIKHDKDITRRQTEINEWYYNDKLETLFFLQLFFMVLLAMAIILFLQNSGIITNIFAAYCTFILMFAVVMTGLYRYRYTSEFRDGRFWHRRNFREKETVSFQEPECECGKPPSESQLGKEIKDCAKKGLENAKGAATGTVNYLGDTVSPYAQILAAEAAGIGIVGTVGTIAFANQLIDDSDKVYKRVGSTVDNVISEYDTSVISYMQGNGQPAYQSSTNTGSCPFT
jgi:hypothetical protein